MVSISTKGKEKVSEETPKRRHFTRSDSKKLMGDAMKSSITTTAERRKKRKSGEEQEEERNLSCHQTSISGMGLGPMGSENDPGESKQSIVNNLRLQKVLGGRVFDPDIITKHGMNSLYDLVEIQSWTHLLQTKSPILHVEEVRNFYYNIEFEEDGSKNTRVGDKSLHLTEELLGQVLGYREKGSGPSLEKLALWSLLKNALKSLTHDVLGFKRNS
ncbi:hypothetical protein KY285_027320 [Solanum tuberosum]|nr:hypothetical protein KY285_027320 [Solanum tuberosum]